MNLSTNYCLIFLLLIQQKFCNYYCKNDATIKREIQSIEKNYIGEGSFGKIYGNESFVSKTMKTDDSVSLYLLNNELKVMIAYNTEYDFTQLHPDNCWYKYNNRMYNYEVKAKMDRMASDMKAALKRSSLKSRSIWKIDMMFKVLISLKKLHDNNILHLDLKEGNIMMMNDYTPVIADFGMALLNGETRKWVGGTPLFMAPEVKSAIYQKGADIYALGIIFFQMLNEKFINNQNFRKLCNQSETTYSNIYCLFDETINDMTKRSINERPSINRIILKVLEVMKKYIESNPNNLDEYMQDELNSFNSSRANPATKLNLEKLIEKLDERKTIYQEAANGASESQLRDLINNYSQTQKDIQKFFKENPGRASIVGKNKQQIKDQNELVDDEEDNLKSIKNIQQRMNNADKQRLDLLKDERFFRDEDIQDRVVDLPKVHLPKRAPSNNIEALRRQQNQAHQKLPILNPIQNKNKVIPKQKLIPSNNFNLRKAGPSNNFKVQKNIPQKNQQIGQRVPKSNNILVQKQKLKPSNNFNQMNKKVTPSNQIQQKKQHRPIFEDKEIEQDYQNFKQRNNLNKPLIKDSNYFAQRIAQNLNQQSPDHQEQTNSQIMRKIDEGLLNGKLNPRKQDLKNIQHF